MSKMSPIIPNKAPHFWKTRGLKAMALWPASLIYRSALWLRRWIQKPTRVSAPVICVGNMVVGGAGKTPVVMALCDLIKKNTPHQPHVILRGYGGRLTQTTRVDLDVHDYHDVGDEALLIAAHAPCWVGIDRIASAQAAIAAGATLIIMDDGLQNPSLYKDCVCLVYDAVQGVGNGWCLPAGPLREKPISALSHSDLIIVFGENSVRPEWQNIKAFFLARIEAIEAFKDSTKEVIAFCGIGRPEKFFTTLQEHGYKLIEAIAYPDHHPYTEADICSLTEKVNKIQWGQVSLITTTKDYVRIPPIWRSKIGVFPVSAVFENEEELLRALNSKLF